jgi:sugar-specific transcriptional regulator TrmB
MLLSEETLRTVLRHFGLTETESGIYLFLAKHEALTGTEIAGQIKKDKAQVFRALKSLQTKGLAESTLEVPARFSPVSFERVVESTIKAKKDEAAHIESSKQELLDYWKNISKSKLDFNSEKFMVIEGRSNIYHKIGQIIKETKNQFSTITTVNGLIRADQFGLYDIAFKNPQKSTIEFRFLTDISKENASTVKAILNKTLKKGVMIRGRNPDLGLGLFPRMVIRDNEEIVIFITHRNALSSEEQDDLCIWTNCKDIVQTFRAVFEDSWQKATEINEKITQIETCKNTSQIQIIENAQLAKKKYNEVLNLAKNEVFIVNSIENLSELQNYFKALKKGTKSLSIKIMLPITNRNLEAALQLSEYCEVKHIPTGHQNIVIVDDAHLFRFPNDQAGRGNVETKSNFGNTVYTNDLKFVEKTKTMLNDLWKNAQIPSATTLDLVNKQSRLPVAKTISTSVSHIAIEKKIDLPKLTERDVLTKIINAKGNWANTVSQMIITYGTNAQAIVHPPKFLNLPDLLFHLVHNEKHSAYGAEDAILIHLWLETPSGHSYVPVAFLTDNLAASDFWKKFLTGCPASQNIQVLGKTDLEVRVHGNMLSAMWTKQIPLFNEYCLPPSCLLVEGYGPVYTETYTVLTPSGYKMKTEYNGLDGFVTYFHPSSKYSGPGTDGYFGRDTIMEFYAP